MISHAPKGRRIYAIGDVHGRADLLDRLLAKIVRDANERPGLHNVLVYLGDYVDRGPDSAGVIERIAEPPAGFEALRLLGNHELMMREVLGGNAEWLDTWEANSGASTLLSYGVSGPWGEALIRTARSTIPAKHLSLLDSLAASHVEGDYFFAHAGVRPGVPLEAQRTEDLVWIRRTFLDATNDFGKIVVHGHSISPEVVFAANRIGLDTGAYRSNILSALVLEGAERRLIQTDR